MLYEYQELLEEIDERGENLTEWEMNFVADLVDDPPETLSKRQTEVLRQIYEERRL